MNELEALAQLTALCDIIERNNWNHLYKQIPAPVIPAVIRLQQENTKLQNELFELRHKKLKYFSIIAKLARELKLLASYLHDEVEIEKMDVLKVVPDAASQ